MRRMYLGSQWEEAIGKRYEDSRKQINQLMIGL